MSSYQKEYYAANRERLLGQQKAYRDSARGRARRFRKAGITDVDSAELVWQTQKVCQICQAPPAGKDLAVDHCHETGRVRGMLCAKCNKALGLLGDNEAGLLRALEYLK